MGQVINSDFIGASNKTLSVFEKTRLNKYGQSIQRFQYFLQKKKEKISHSRQKTLSALKVQKIKK